MTTETTVEGRNCECACGHKWFAPLERAANTPNISGEKTNWCPKCHKKAVSCGEVTTAPDPRSETSNLADYISAGGDPDSGENQGILRRLVDREVLHCISSTVSALVELCADGKSAYVDYDELLDLSRAYDYEEPGAEHVGNMDRAELLEWLAADGAHADDIVEAFGWERAPQLLYDEEGIEGYTYNKPDRAEVTEAGDEIPEAVVSDAELRQMVIDRCGDWKEFCEQHDVEPHENEVYEHWAVTSWFEARLAEHGQCTGELLDFNVWGRCTTGQAIHLDSVIAEIGAEMQILDGQAHTWAE